MAQVTTKTAPVDVDGAKASSEPIRGKSGPGCFGVCMLCLCPACQTAQCKSSTFNKFRQVETYITNAIELNFLHPARKTRGCCQNRQG